MNALLSRSLLRSVGPELAGFICVIVSMMGSGGTASDEPQLTGLRVRGADARKNVGVITGADVAAWN